jgi:PAS domain S-box-containing protein
MGARLKKTILLVEDEYLIALHEKKDLEDYGYEVITASSGEKAIDAALKAPGVDLALMDINLGAGIDGTKAAEMILRNRDIPIVFLSSHEEKEIVEKTERITSYGYVVKSSSITVLDASIKMAFKLFDANRKTKILNDKLEATLDALPDALFEVGLDGCYYDIHSPHAELMYKSIDFLLGKRLSEVMPPRVAEVMMSAILEAHEKGESAGKQYEITVPAGTRWFEISVSRIASYSDNPRFILLRRDVTERKRVEEELRFQASILDQIGDLVTATDLSGKIMYVNEAECKTFGKKREEIIGSTTDIYGEDAERGMRQKDLLALLSERGSWSGEVINFDASGKRLVMSCRMWTLLDAVGKPKALVSVAQDMTEHRRAEEEAREGEALHGAILQAAIDGYWLTDTRGRILDVNESYCRMSGYGRRELLGMSIADIAIADRADEVSARMERVFAHGLERFDSRHRRKDGSVLEVEVSVKTLSIGGDRIVSFFKDLTETRGAEAAREKSLERFRVISDFPVDSEYWVSPEGELLYQSPSIERITGYPAEEFIADHPGLFYRIVHPEDKAEFFKAFLDDANASERPCQVFRIVDRRGEVRWLETVSRKVYGPSGEYWGIRGSSRDITERKVAEEALKTEKERLRNVLIGTKAGTWEWNVQTGEFLFDEESAALLGYSLPELGLDRLEAWMGLKHPDDRKTAEELLMGHVRGESELYSAESRMRRKDGDWAWIHSRGKVIEWSEDGRPLRMFGTHVDVSTRKRAEEELRESEFRLSRAEGVASIGNWTYFLDSRSFELSKGMRSIFGVEAEAPSLDDIRNIDLPEYHAMLDAAISDLIEKGLPYDVEFKIHRLADGAIADIRSIADFDRANRVMYGVVQDITRQKRSEAVLRESEERNKLIAEMASDYVFKFAISAGGGSEIVFVGDSLYKRTGLDPAAETSIESWIRLIHPEDRAKALELKDRLVERPLKAELECRMTSRSDRLVWISIIVKSERDEGLGRVVSVIGAVKDISERKFAEEQVKSLLADKELLLKEVHHRIKNNIGTMMSLLSMQSSSTEDPRVAKALGDAENRLRSMSILYDKIYRSANLRRMSIKDYLPRLVEEIVKVFPNREAVRVEARVDDFPLGIKELSVLGIVVNEIVTNAMKYAFIGREAGMISVSASRAGGRAAIEIGDDGIGIPASVDLDKPQAFGLMLIGNLIKQLDGAMRIEVGEGTRFLFEFDAGED